MTNEELKETAFELLDISENLKLHQVSANAICSLRSLDRRAFNYHAGEYVSTIFETLKNEISVLQEITERLLKAEEEGNK